MLLCSKANKNKEKKNKQHSVENSPGNKHTAAAAEKINEKKGQSQQVRTNEPFI